MTEAKRTTTIELWEGRRSLDSDVITNERKFQAELGWTDDVHKTHEDTVGCVGVLAPFSLTFSYWSYSIDKYFDPPQVIAEGREKCKKFEMPERFYFDFGSNGHPVWVTLDELEAAFIRLGLIGETHE